MKVEHDARTSHRGSAQTPRSNPVARYTESLSSDHAIRTWAANPLGLSALAAILVIEFVRRCGTFEHEQYMASSAGIAALLVPFGLAGMVYRRRWGYTMSGILLAITAARVFADHSDGALRLLATSALALASLCFFARERAPTGHPVWDALNGPRESGNSRIETITYASCAVLGVLLLAGSIWLAVGAYSQGPGPGWVGVPLGFAGVALAIGVGVQPRFSMAIGAFVGVLGTLIFLGTASGFSPSLTILRPGSIDLFHPTFGAIALAYVVLWASWRVGLDGIRRYGGLASFLNRRRGGAR